MTDGSDTPGAGQAAPSDVVQLDRLRALIRQQAARRPDAPAPDRPPIDWSQVVACLHQAEQHANIGRRPPPLPARFGAPVRFLAGCFARVAAYFARYLLTEQREFNNAALGCLRSLQLGLYQLEQELARARERRPSV